MSGWRLWNSGRLRGVVFWRSALPAIGIIRTAARPMRIPVRRDFAARGAIDLVNRIARNLILNPPVCGECRGSPSGRLPAFAATIPPENEQAQLNIAT